MDPDNGHSHPHLPLPSPNDPANDPTGPPDVHYAAPRPYRHDHASMDYTFTQHPQLSHAAAYPDAHMATESHYHPLPQHQQEPPYGNHVAAESIHGTRLNLPEQGSHASRELMPNMPTQQHERLSETFTDHLPPHPMFAPPSRVIHLPPCTVVGYSPSPHHAPYDAHLVNGMAHNYNPIHAVGHGHPFSHDGARPASAEHSNASIPSAHPMSSQNHRYDLSTSASPPSGSQVQSVRSSSYTPPAHPAGVSSIPMSKDSAWKNTSLSTALECKPSQPKRPATQEPPQSQSRAVSETDSHSAASPERTPPPKNSRSGTTQPTTKPKKVKKPKMHPCTVCQKTFPRPSGLQTHMNTHYNLKPFHCVFPGCARAFAVRSNAKRHLRTHGPNAIPPPVPPGPSFQVDFHEPFVLAAEANQDISRHHKLRWIPVPVSLTSRSNASALRSISDPESSDDEIESERAPSPQSTP